MLVILRAVIMRAYSVNPLVPKMIGKPKRIEPLTVSEEIFVPDFVTFPCNTPSMTAGNVPCQEQKFPSETSLEPRKDDF